jgi:hypothetical protein
MTKKQTTPETQASTWPPHYKGVPLSSNIPHICLTTFRHHLHTPCAKVYSSHLREAPEALSHMFPFFTLPCP